jgi:hypothetical protein
MSISRKLWSLFIGGALAATFVVTAAVNVSAATANGACAGGTVAPGTYRNLTITGFCMVDGGNVTVERNVHVMTGGALDSLFSESTLSVAGNLIVERGGLLALGCDPVELACMDNPAGTSSDSVGGNLIGDAAVLMIVHDNHIGGNVEQSGGGGGFSCNPLFPNGPPAYTDYANNTIGGGASVTGLRTCWAGFSHNMVGKNVAYNDNHGSVLTGDANLMDGNHVSGKLQCSGNSPAPHLSDTPVKIMNVAGKGASGQCMAITA